MKEAIKMYEKYGDEKISARLLCILTNELKQ